MGGGGGQMDMGKKQTLSLSKEFITVITFVCPIQNKPCMQLNRCSTPQEHKLENRFV